MSVTLRLGTLTGTDVAVLCAGVEPDELRCLHRHWLAQPTALVGAIKERTDFTFDAQLDARPRAAGAPTPAFTELTPQDCGNGVGNGMYDCTYPWGASYTMLLPHPCAPTLTTLHTMPAKPR
jgi:hypothetical protein